MDRKKILIKIIFTVASLAVTAGIFIYLFRYITIGQVLQIIKGVDRGALLMFVTLSLAMSFFRAWRYDLLLGISGYRPSRSALFLVVLVRNFFSDLLPARIGTLVYIFIVNTRLGVPLGPATSSFAVAFLFDILAVVPLILLASVLAVFSVKTYILPLFLGGLLIGALTIAIIHYLPSFCSVIIQIIAKIKKEKSKYGRRLIELLSSVKEEVLKAKQAELYTPVLVLSFLVRITKYGSLYVFLYALLHAVGYGWRDLSIPSIFLGISASEFAASLPISGIASFGAYEGTWAIVFELLGFPGNVAKLTAVSHHLFTQVYGYSLGGVALVILILPIFKKRSDFLKHRFSVEPKRLFYKKIVACSLGLTAVLYGFSRVSPANSASSIKKIEADHPSPAEKKMRNLIAVDFPGVILFDSNRSGTFGIYSIHADGSSLKQIIDDSNWHEMFPDPSPDGKQIVFARSKSLNRLAPSEIWIAGSNGSNPSKLVENGNFPTFSSNGKKIYFERQRKKAMVFDLETRSETEMFPGSNKKFKKYQVVKPRVSFNGRIVAFISDVPERWNAWYADIKEGETLRIENGCEPVPFSQGEKIAFIGNLKAKERTGILSFNISDRSIEKIEDADAPRGHEYFPTLASHDRYLLYGACRPEEHSHETGNYQIFIKDLKTGRKARITFDAFTNRWPKLLQNKNGK